ncbi:hypothetical protein ACLKA6_005778 [Drosophila palustris]
MAATGPETESTTLHATQSASQSPQKSAASDTASAAVPSSFSSIQISVLDSNPFHKFLHGAVKFRPYLCKSNASSIFISTPSKNPINR